MPPRVSIRIVSHHPQTLHTLRLAINPSQGIANPLFFCLIPLPPSWPILPTCFPLKYPCKVINSPNPLSVATSAATFIASFETASAKTKNSSWASCCSLVESRRRIAGRVWSACRSSTGRRAGGLRFCGVFRSGHQYYRMNIIRKEGHVPYRIVRRASETGVGRSTSTAKFTILSRWDKSDVTDANACVLALHIELKWKGGAYLEDRVHITQCPT